MRDPAAPDTFATVIADIWTRRFTGRFSVDCQSGVPRVIEFHGEPTRIRLDVDPKEAHITTQR